MLDDKKLKEEVIENEIARIKILFIKNNYDEKEKKWFIQSRMNSAKDSFDLLTLEVCNRLLNELK